ncbi:unnamed protein product [Mycena citricolor]|uniref:Uncharacterized protein n=1 Tax=Mycena citricolor TaxID=2018698 RepID=A0AAD2H1Q4_9AGAR|nr:unnamed protein product [Mycena citricolor]
MIVPSKCGRVAAGNQQESHLISMEIRSTDCHSLSSVKADKQPVPLSRWALIALALSWTPRFIILRDHGKSADTSPTTTSHPHHDLTETRDRLGKFGTLRDDLDIYRRDATPERSGYQFNAPGVSQLSCYLETVTHDQRCMWIRVDIFRGGF